MLCFHFLKTISCANDSSKPNAVVLQSLDQRRKNQRCRAGYWLVQKYGYPNMPLYPVLLFGEGVEERRILNKRLGCKLNCLSPNVILNKIKQ